MHNVMGWDTVIWLYLDMDMDMDMDMGGMYDEMSQLCYDRYLRL